MPSDHPPPVMTHATFTMFHPAKAQARGAARRCVPLPHRHALQKPRCAARLGVPPLVDDKQYNQ